MTEFSLLEKYFKGQSELGFPDYYIWDKKFDWSGLKAESKISPRNVAAETNAEKVETSQKIREVKLVEYAQTAQNSQITAAVKIVPPQTEDTEQADKRQIMIELYNRCKNCSACSLGKTRKKFVFGAGTVYTDVLAIGEAPGEQEDIEGKPFVGAAGQLLSKMLAAIGIERDKIFIANVIKCRPPQNRKPNNQEIAACFPMLKKQISVIKPKAILLLGGTAANTVLQNEKTVSALRGVVHYYENIPAIVTYHPSALLRDAANKKPAWDDLQKFQRLLAELKK